VARLALPRHFDGVGQLKDRNLGLADDASLVERGDALEMRPVAADGRASAPSRPMR